MRNAGPWVAACIESIQAQSLTDWELIVVNDHSTDESLHVVRSFSELDHRIHPLENEGVGIIPALQTAMRSANAEMITRMDADDLMPPDKLEVLYSLASRNKASVATGMVKYFGIEVSEGYRAYERWLNDRVRMQDHWKWIYRECVISSANWMTHRKHLNFESLEYPEDYVLVFNWYAKGLQIEAATSVTHHWREHPARTSRNSDHYEQAAFFDLKLRRFLMLDYNPESDLFILGNNVKSKLVQQILDENGVNASYIDKTQVDRISMTKKKQVLLAVYPSEHERLQIKAWLENLKLQNGHGYWWL